MSAAAATPMQRCAIICVLNYKIAQNYRGMAGARLQESLQPSRLVGLQERFQELRIVRCAG